MTVTIFRAGAAGSSTGIDLALVTQDAAITLDSATHKGKTVELTGSTNRTWDFTAAATLGSTWSAVLVNSGTAELTLDPNGAETIDGLTSFKMYPGEMRLVVCTGSAFKSYVIHPFYLTINTSGAFTFTTPPGYRLFEGRLGAGGGAGGKGNTAAGSGGGGGASVPFCLRAATFGTTETITVAASVAGQASTNTAGTDGNNSTIGSLLTSYGGGGGGGGGATNSGGGGGGQLSKGRTGGAAFAVTNNTANLLDILQGTVVGAGSGGLPLGGVSHTTTTVPTGSRDGGGAGGGASAIAGGDSINGGGGGGYFGTTTVAGANGGASEWGGGGGAGGAQDNAPGPGTGGASTKGGGTGGNGGYDAVVTGVDGTNGANGGGGGGGGGTESGTSGAGGAGSCAIWGVV